MKNKIIAVSMILCMILGTAAVETSARITTDDETSVVKISGTVESGEADVLVGIEVFCPDMDAEDFKTITPAEYARVVAQFGQAVSGENGKWEYELKIKDNPDIDYDARSGEYTVVIFPEDSEKSYTETFMYVNLAEAELVIDELKDAADEDVAGIMDARKYALGINYSFYDKIDIEKAADMLCTEIEAGIFDEKNIAECVNAVRSTVLIEALTKGEISNIFEYSDVLGIDEYDIAPFAEKDYVVANQESITKKLKGESIESFDEFNDSLTEATVLAVVKNPDGEDNVKEITEAFDDEIGFDAPLSDKAYRKVMGKDFDSYSDLAKALKDADKQSGSTGGSSGGGGGSGRANAQAAVSIPSSSEVTSMNPDIFNDIDDVSWAKDAIIYLAQKGIVNGKSENTFAPDDFVTREEAAKILVLAFAPETEGADIFFEDVKPEDWYYDFVSRAVGAGMVTGYSDKEFGSGDRITRQDMVTMIYRGAVNSGIVLEEGQIGFADEADIAEYAREAVGALAKAEIVSGTDFRNFEPGAYATRAQLAKIVYRLLEL